MIQIEPLRPADNHIVDTWPIFPTATSTQNCPATAIPVGKDKSLVITAQYFAVEEIDDVGEA